MPTHILRNGAWQDLSFLSERRAQTARADIGRSGAPALAASPGARRTTVRDAFCKSRMY